MKPPATRCTAFRALPWIAKANALVLFGALAGFSALLLPAWRHDDNLSHGIFLPVLAAILAVESRKDSSPRFLRPGAGLFTACAVLVLASLVTLTAAITYASALGWTHAMAEFLLSVSLVFALGAAWLSFADARVRFLPVNWAAAVAILLWLFASPPPPGTYARVALFLQSEVTRGVVKSLKALGIAAYQDGNVIGLARTSVGVSEACSGVRSLLSCTVAGLFLSALLVRRPAHRAVIVVLSPAIGLGMNFFRSLLLTLVANAGVNIEGRWHDVTGASILVVTTLLVAFFAFWLHRLEPPFFPESGAPQPPPAGHSPLQGMIAAALLLAAGTATHFVGKAHAFREVSGRVPDLSALLPAAPPGWTEVTTPNLDQFSGILHTHVLVEREYSGGSAPGAPQLTLYLAYWRPGEAPVSLVDAHTPDACWPGSGWEPEHVLKERSALEIGNRRLPPAEYRLFGRDGSKTHVWFWHLYGGRPIAFVDPYSAARLLRLAWHYGFGPPEDQLFVRVSSNRPWQEVASEPALQQFFVNLTPLGL